MRKAFLLLLVLIPLFSQVNHDSSARDELIIFAASSLTDAFESIGEAFIEENPDVEILFNFAGSSTLANQLLNGAPADIFASANLIQMQIVVEDDLITGEPQTFAGNQLILITPADNTAEIESLHDLTTPDLKFIVAAPDVPIREYTELMLERLAEDSDFGEGFYQAVLNNIVSEERNVRQIVAKVALGEADAGIVYTSDVTPDIAEDVSAIIIPDEFNTLATYPIGLLAESRQPEHSQAFIDFVLSEMGQEILVEWGFIPTDQIKSLSSRIDCDKEQ